MSDVLADAQLASNTNVNRLKTLLTSEVDCITNVSRKYPGARIHVTGHSLGAGSRRLSLRRTPNLHVPVTFTTRLMKDMISASMRTIQATTSVSLLPSWSSGSSMASTGGPSLSSVSTTQQVSCTTQSSLSAFHSFSELACCLRAPPPTESRGILSS